MSKYCIALILFINIHCGTHINNKLNTQSVRTEAKKDYVRDKYHVFLNHKLDTKFVTNGQLWAGRPTEFAGILPFEAFEKLYLLSNSKLKLINNLNNFSHFVRINSKVQAMDFVKLRTSKATFRLFLEKQKRDIDINGCPVTRGYGVTTLPSESVSWNGNRFFINHLIYERSLVSAGESIVLLKESVSPNGEYKVISRTKLGSPKKFGVKPYIPAIF